MATAPDNRPIGSYSRQIPRDRRFKINRWVKIRQPNGDTLNAKISDISRTGCRIECMVKPDTDKPVTIMIDQAKRLNARIVWSSVGAYGCQFDVRLNDRELTEIVWI
ncbi:PilZ domain-containing protein [Altererythrobacter lutimaris]|uniref:PilZ domain-containing protein n=1 Tax=Altererythrobacter lutimaris TaxID=2743979 RepID=A0A850H891_9SPHN|nr:PilZ domain-containing protein [Altererythrobacter lutimaris]NVE93750.1 PilZ domain-containing protein [Altererythrobacter lutimaris]